MCETVAEKEVSTYLFLFPNHPNWRKRKDGFYLINKLLLYWMKLES